MFLWVFKPDFNFLNSNIDPRNVTFVTLTSFIVDFLHANNFSFKFNNKKVDIRARHTFIPSYVQSFIQLYSLSAISQIVKYAYEGKCQKQGVAFDVI